MGIIVRPDKRFSNPGSNQYAPIVGNIASIPRAEEWNEDLDTLYNEVNGNLSGENFKDTGLDIGSAKFTGTLGKPKGGLGLTTGVRFPVGVSIRNDTIDASSTEFCAIQSSVLFSGTESVITRKFPFGGRIRNVYVRTTTAQSATGSLVIRLRKNSANSQLVVTVAAGDPAGTYSDTTNVEYFTPTDAISIAAVNSATAVSAAVVSISFEMLPN